ncbi:MAG: glycosyltransferase family 2 protein [Alicyclobacillaceae bacterium]|nr:glycosyltransferase family 2 protein [Alicyclobacillaceae bacterium]
MDLDFVQLDLVQLLINGFFILLQVVAAVVGLYQVALSLFGLRRRRKTKEHPPTKSFAILVAAHNEEAVIGPLIENLRQLDYPKELYDVFVICDNCTDRTAAIAREAGAIAYERFDREKRGKGYAIEWMLEQLWKRPRQYDAVVMFDADNLVSTNFLRVMNNKLCDGARVVQGYLDVKNPYDSWVSISYACAYWFTNRMWQLARYNLGLPNALGGTGVCVETSLLKEIGWGATSLTEDLEFGVRCVMNGVYPTWAHDACVYDEKPLTLKASMRQRLRWMQGHFDCAHRYFWPLIRKSIRMRNWAMLDAALYLFQPMRMLIVLLTTGMLYFQVFSPGFFTLTNISQLFPNWFWVILNIFLYAQLPLAMLLERIPWKAFLGLLVVPVFMLTWFPVTTAAFFTRKNRVWNHTLHTRAIRLDELRSR